MLFIAQVLSIALMNFSTVYALPQPQATPPTPAPPATPTTLPPLSRDMTMVQRFQALLVKGDSLLTGDALRKLVVFPFTDAKPASGSTGGATKAANVQTFPILSGLGISTTLAFLSPCGINTPHVHPRATEFLTLTSGSNLRFGYVLENGLVAPGQNAEISGTLNQYEGTVFPQGSIHYQFNDSCEKAVFVAALNSEDPGTLQVAQGFFGLDSGVVNATLGFTGGRGVVSVEGLRKKIPANLVRDVEGCLKRCGGKKA